MLWIKLWRNPNIFWASVYHKNLECKNQPKKMLRCSILGLCSPTSPKVTQLLWGKPSLSRAFGSWETPQAEAEKISPCFMISQYTYGLPNPLVFSGFSALLYYILYLYYLYCPYANECLKVLTSKRLIMRSSQVHFWNSQNPSPKTLCNKH